MLNPERVERPGHTPYQATSQNTLWVIQAALLLFVFLIPLETLGRDTETSSITVARIAGLILLMSCILRPSLILRPPHRLTTLALVLAVYALAMTAFMDRASLMRGLERFITWIQLIVFYHISMPLLKSSKLRSAMVYAYVAGAALSAILLYSGINLNQTMLEKDRVALGNADPNIQAGMIGLAAVWCLAIATDVGRLSLIKRITFLSIFIGLTSTCFLTGSRGGLLAICLAMSTFLFSRKHKLEKLFQIAILLISVTIIASILFKNQIMTQRIFNTIYEGDVAGRYFIYLNSIDLWFKHPWFGWGLGSNEIALGGYTGTLFRDMHNIFLYTLTATGIFGTSLLLFLFFSHARNALSLPNGRLRQIAVCGLVFILAHGLSVTNMFYKFFWLALLLTSPVVATLRPSHRA